MASESRKKQRHRAVPLMPEVRHLRASGLEVRDAGGEGNSVTVTGLAIVYETPYSVVDQFGEFEERMMPGVATDVMGADVRYLIDHDPSRVLGRTASGTLKLTDTPEGLRSTVSLDLRDSDARNLLVRIERGDVNQMSCGFIVARDEWNEDMDQRTVHKFADLLDVSAVTYPASPTTSLQVAQRMMLRMTPESSARIDRIFRETRAGKAISGSNAEMILKAVEALHGVLDSAGVQSGFDRKQQAVDAGTGSPDDDGKGTVEPEEPTDEANAPAMPVHDDRPDAYDNGDGLAAGPEYDPGDQIRSKPASAEILAEVTKLHGKHRTQRHRESTELLRQAESLIIKKKQ